MIAYFSTHLVIGAAVVPGNRIKNNCLSIPTLNLSPQVSIGAQCRRLSGCRRAVSAASVYATLRGAPQKIAFRQSQNCEHSFFISTQNDDMLPLWINYRKLSISVPNRCNPPMPPLHGWTQKNIPRKNRLYLYGVDILPGFSGTAGCGLEACQGQKPPLWRRALRCAGKPNSYRQPPAFCPFRLQNCVYCPKNIFHCPKRTKSDKKKTENKCSPGVASF